MEKRFFRETVFLLLASMLLLPCSVAAADMTEEDELDRAAQIGLELSLVGQFEGDGHVEVGRIDSPAPRHQAASHFAYLVGGG